VAQLCGQAERALELAAEALGDGRGITCAWAVKSGSRFEKWHSLPGKNGQGVIGSPSTKPSQKYPAKENPIALWRKGVIP
jgi:hypothetical protein